MRRALQVIATCLTFLAPFDARAVSLVGDTPEPRHKPAMVLDTRRDRFLAFGGLGELGALADVWQHPAADTGEWCLLPCAGSPPPPRFGHVAVYDPVGDRLIVFGGNVPGRGPVGDVWELLLSLGPTWRRMYPAGESPEPRFAHTAVLDASRHRMIVFGGYDRVMLGDVWSLSLDMLPTWSRIVPGGEQPSPRDAHVAVFDGERRRMIVQGGFDGADALDETWALDLKHGPRWKPILGRTVPPPRRQHAAAWDSAGRRMFIFGGTVNGSDRGLGDTWALSADSGEWVRVDAPGETPPPRWGPAIGYVPALRGLFVFAGSTLRGRRNDTWWLDCSEPPQWRDLSAEPASPEPVVQPPRQEPPGCTVKSLYR